jgi:hypothetical protein
MQQDLIAGAAVRVVLNGKIVGFATSISVTRDQGVKPIYGIDQVNPQEIAVSGPYSVGGSLDGFRVRNFGGYDGFGVINASSMNDMFYQKSAVLELVDRKTNITFARIVGVIFHQDSFTVTNKAVITFSARFTGTYMFNEISDKKNPTGF